MYDFIYKNDFLYKNVYEMAMGENHWKRMQKRNPRLVALPSPFLRYGGRLFSSVREHRKQNGSTLGGKGS